MNIRLKEKWWITADRSRLVKDGDPAARFLLGIKDRVVEVSEKEARRWGLLEEKKPEAPLVEVKVEAKELPAPENKQAVVSETKQQRQNRQRVPPSSE